MEEDGGRWRRMKEDGGGWKRMEEDGGRWRRMEEDGRGWNGIIKNDEESLKRRKEKTEEDDECKRWIEKTNEEF